MNIKNIVLSVKYVDFVNKIDNLIYELLYSKTNGYILKNSKEALDEAQNVINKFDYEAFKIRKTVNYKDADLIIENKRKNLVKTVGKYYKKQIIIWADEVFENLIQNCILSISLNEENFSDILNRAYEAVVWYSNIKNLSEDETKLIARELENKIINVINSSDNDYLPKKTPKQSDFKVFLNLLDMIIDNKEEFLNYDLAQQSLLLSNDDLNYFLKIQNDLNTYKRTQILDDLMLIKTSISVGQIRSDSDKYLFIKQIQDDFTCFSVINQNKITEQDKTSIVKRRLELFNDKKTKNQEYFRSLIAS